MEPVNWELHRVRLGTMRLRNELFVIGVTLLLCSGAAAEDGLRTFRAWEAFPVGAWKEVRVTKQSLKADGSVASTSVAETRTTLAGIDERGVTLHIDVTVEVENKRLPSSHQEVWYGFNGESRGQSVTIERLTQEAVEVDGERLSARVYRLGTQESGLRRESRVQVVERFPYVLEKRSSLIDVRGDAVTELETLVANVLSLDLPHEVGGELTDSCHVKTVLQTRDARIHTVEVFCANVPGWVVAHWSKRLDAQGRMLERSTLELMDFGFGEVPPRDESR